MTPQSGGSSTDKVIVYLDPDLEAIVPGFLENRRKDAAALDTALHGNDWKTLRLLGHRMKGDGGSYGFEEISRIGDALEQAAMRRDRADVQKQTTALADFLANVEVLYRK
jgi:HPt (histidine-containing phosphotransfer) domain-containing protein